MSLIAIVSFFNWRFIKTPAENYVSVCCVSRDVFSACDYCPLSLTEASYSETPASYGYELERSEELQTRRHPPSLSGSPSSSPRLRSKSQSSRDTQSSGSLESTQSVMFVLLLPLSVPPSSCTVLHRSKVLFCFSFVM